MVEPILSVRGLTTHFFGVEGVTRAVDGVNLDVFEGRTLGIVGESGCGKSVTARSILRIVDRPGRIVGGQAMFRRTEGGPARFTTVLVDPESPGLTRHELPMRYRVRTNEYIGEKLMALGIPIVQPVGGHAVFVDARQFLPHIPPLQYPGQALAVALYERGGIRACEIGTVMFGLRPDGTEVPAEAELVRLAMPRRVYTQSHADYVVEVFEEIVAERERLRGFRIEQQPAQLRHFTAQFAPLLQPSVRCLPAAADSTLAARGLPV